MNKLFHNRFVQLVSIALVVTLVMTFVGKPATPAAAQAFYKDTTYVNAHTYMGEPGFSTEFYAAANVKISAPYYGASTNGLSIAVRVDKKGLYDTYTYTEGGQTNNLTVNGLTSGSNSTIDFTIPASDHLALVKISVGHKDGMHNGDQYGFLAAPTANVIKIDAFERQNLTPGTEVTTSGSFMLDGTATGFQFDPISGSTVTANLHWTGFQGHVYNVSLSCADNSGTTTCPLPDGSTGGTFGGKAQIDFSVTSVADKLGWTQTK